ncbi:MAG: DEAD/DEAH box helicase [Alphaproteobacteria bacterium]
MTNLLEGLPAQAAALKARGIEKLTPVQEAVINPALVGRDMLVSAQTGSGKTVAFGLAMAPVLMAGEDEFGVAGPPLALIIAPTRELALQVTRELEWLFASSKAQFATCVGGMDMRTERRNLARGAHIVVGTPGRLRDHIERGSLDLGSVEAVTLDEADEMLDLGFREDLELILDAAPDQRQTLLFSATVPAAISKMAKRYQRDAERVVVKAEGGQHADITYKALTVAPRDTENAIANVLRFFEPESCIIFCATREAVNRLTSRFTNRGFGVVALSGELSQTERSRSLQAMRDGRARICIATDVAARGIDLPNLDLVIHADLPQNADTMLHRSGRTGRAGRQGVSVVIVPQTMRKKADRLLHFAKVEATWETPPGPEEILARDQERMVAAAKLEVPATEEETAVANQLLSEVNPVDVAVAFMRQRQSGLSAPEELRDIKDGDKAPVKGETSRFSTSVWVSLSVGKQHRAEPKWLVPVLCKSGGLSKGDIGAIRVQKNETYVEIDSAAIDAFMATIAPKHLLEDSIKVDRLKAAPKGIELPAREGGRPHRKGGGGYKGRTDSSGGFKGRGKPGGKPGGFKGRGKPGGKSEGKPEGKPVGKYKGKSGGGYKGKKSD